MGGWFVFLIVLLLAVNSAAKDSHKNGEIRRLKQAVAVSNKARKEHKYLTLSIFHEKVIATGVLLLLYLIWYMNR